MKLRFTSSSQETISIYGNQTKLGNWSASILVTQDDTFLNITTHMTRGLIFGDIENVSFSFNVPSDATTSFISSSLPLLLSHVTKTKARVRMCLRVMDSFTTCQNIHVIRVQVNPDYGNTNDLVDVQTIPVLWHNDKSSLVK